MVKNVIFFLEKMSLTPVFLIYSVPHIKALFFLISKLKIVKFVRITDLIAKKCENQQYFSVVWWEKLIYPFFSSGMH